MYRASIAFCLVILAAGSGLCVLGQEEKDDGNTDELSIAANAASNAIDAMSVPIAELSQLETRIVLQFKAGVVAPDDAANRMYNLSVAYFHKKQWDEAKRLAADGVEYAPESLGAAKCLLMIGNLVMIEPDGFNRAAKVFSKADGILQELIAKRPNDQLFQYRSVMLNRLGFCYEYENPEMAIRAHTELLETPDVFRMAGEERIRGAVVSLAQISTRRGNMTDARKYFDKLADIANSKQTSPEDAVRYLYMRVNALWPQHDDPERLKCLEEMWKSERLAETSGILEVGDDLIAAYFFSEPMRKVEFDRVSKLQLSRIRSLLNRRAADPSIPLPTRFESIHGTCLITATDFANGKLDRKKVIELTDEFIKVFENKEMLFSVPSHRPMADLQKLRTLYLITMPEHVKAILQRQQDIKDL